MFVTYKQIGLGIRLVLMSAGFLLAKFWEKLVQSGICDYDHQNASLS